MREGVEIMTLVSIYNLQLDLVFLQCYKLLLHAVIGVEALESNVTAEENAAEAGAAELSTSYPGVGAAYSTCCC